MGMTPEETLDTLKTTLNQIQASLTVVTINQTNFQEAQKTIIRQVDEIVKSLYEPNQSAMGRSLINEMNGIAQRFDKALSSINAKVLENEITITNLNAQALKVEGALNLIKFIGVAGIISGIIALLSFVKNL